MADSKESKTADSLLGFLVVEPTVGSDGFIAALMVTDKRGYPMEFKATTPVKPSLVQRTLYGARLQKYVGVELCGKGLVRQVSRKPLAVLVADRDLLEVASGADADVLAIRRAGDHLKVEGDAGDSSARGTIRGGSGESQPLIYESRPRDARRENEILRFVEECAGQFDLLEAFDRMREALKLLAKEDPRYR